MEHIRLWMQHVNNFLSPYDAYQQYDSSANSFTNINHVWDLTKTVNGVDW